MAVTKIGVRVQYIDAGTVKQVLGTFSNNGVFIPDYAGATSGALVDLQESVQDTLDAAYPDNLTPV